jgi:hypothetical protein
MFFWHQLLLEQMTKEVPGIRPAVISTETVTKSTPMDLRWGRKESRDLLEPAVISKQFTRGGDRHGAARAARMMTANISAETRHLVVAFMSRTSFLRPASID